VEYQEDSDQEGFAHLWRSAQRRRGIFLASWFLQFWCPHRRDRSVLPPSTSAHTTSELESDGSTKAA
jgi:hypothetical protein